MLGYELQQFSQSVIAIACVLAARLLSKITPLWSPHLEYITFLEYGQVKECTEMLLK